MDKLTTWVAALVAVCVYLELPLKSPDALRAVWASRGVVVIPVVPWCFVRCSLKCPMVSKVPLRLPTAFCRKSMHRFGLWGVF